jgi:hypothetical protein
MSTPAYAASAVTYGTAHGLMPKCATAVAHKGLSDDPLCADVVAAFSYGETRTAFDKLIPAISRSMAPSSTDFTSDYS